MKCKQHRFKTIIKNKSWMYRVCGLVRTVSGSVTSLEGMRDLVIRRNQT